MSNGYETNLGIICDELTCKNGWKTCRFCTNKSKDNINCYLYQCPLEWDLKGNDKLYIRCQRCLEDFKISDDRYLGL